MDRIIQEEELRASDGQEEGRPALLAYKGKVYDVSESKLWRNGVHVRRHQAGQDLTASLSAAPHDESVFERVPVVGALAAVEEETAEKELPALLDWFLDQHPHPVAVHFPVALTVAAAVFLALYLLTGNESFELSGYYVLWMAVIMAPLAILTGATSWWFNYRRAPTPLFKGKIGLSIVLLALAVIALALRTANPASVVNREGAGWLYALVVVAMVAVVSGLGWLGAKITFPSGR